MIQDMGFEITGQACSKEPGCDSTGHPKAEQSCCSQNGCGQ